MMAVKMTVIDTMTMTRMKRITDYRVRGGSSNKMWSPQGNVTFQLWQRRPVRGVFSFGEGGGGWGGVFRAVTDSGGHYTSRLWPQYCSGPSIPLYSISGASTAAHSYAREVFEALPKSWNFQKSLCGLINLTSPYPLAIGH